MLFTHLFNWTKMMNCPQVGNNCCCQCEKRKLVVVVGFCIESFSCEKRKVFVLVSCEKRKFCFVDISSSKTLSCWVSCSINYEIDIVITSKVLDQPIVWSDKETSLFPVCSLFIVMYSCINESITLNNLVLCFRLALKDGYYSR